MASLRDSDGSSAGKLIVLSITAMAIILRHSQIVRLVLTNWKLREICAEDNICNLFLPPLCYSEIFPLLFGPLFVSYSF